MQLRNKLYYKLCYNKLFLIFPSHGSVNVNCIYKLEMVYHFVFVVVTSNVPQSPIANYDMIDM